VTSSPAGDPVEGERRRDHALDRLRVHRAHLVRGVQRALLSYLLTHGPSTSDPIRDLVQLPPGIDPRLVGAAARRLAELDLICRAGLSRSVRPEAHSRDLPVWDVTDRRAAMAWLATHPNLPEPVPGEGDTDQQTLWN
jgi:hypothetical protein